MSYFVLTPQHLARQILDTPQCWMDDGQRENTSILQGPNLLGEAAPTTLVRTQPSLLNPLFPCSREWAKNIFLEEDYLLH